MGSDARMRWADRWTYAFYVAVAATAYVGQVTAAHKWLGDVTILEAAVPVAVLELGGVALAARADARRRLGERAYITWALAVAVAVFAVTFNYIGHASDAGPTAASWYFGGMSALGVATYLVQSADRRRDALRAAGQLRGTPPVYGLVQWLREPRVTHRARQIALATPGIDWAESLAQARDELRAEARRREIGRALARAIRERYRDRTAARIALSTYDMGRLAAEIETRADYEAWARIVARHLTPPGDEADRPATANGGEVANGGGEADRQTAANGGMADRPTTANGGMATHGGGMTDRPATANGGEADRPTAANGDEAVDPRMITRIAIPPAPPGGRPASETRRLVELLKTENPARTQEILARMLGISRRSLRDALRAAARADMTTAPTSSAA